MNISKGIKKKAIKAVIQGLPGVGKSDLSSKFPNSFHLDIEGSTNELDIVRNADPINSFAALSSMINDFKRDQMGFKTLVVDTIDWAETLAANQVCQENKWVSIEDPGFGKGWRPVHDLFGKLLNELTEIVNLGCNVVLLAHTSVKGFTPPDSDGSYDRYVMKLQKTIGSYVNEWADMILFLNYKTHIVEDSKTKKLKGQGQRRICCTEYSAAWDAKNRFGLPSEIDITKNQDGSDNENVKKITCLFESTPANTSKPIENSKPAAEPVQENPTTIEENPVDQNPTSFPSGLYDLMQMDDVSEREVRWVQSKGKKGVGYFPKDMPIESYSDDIVQGILIAKWNSNLLPMIQKARLETPNFLDGIPETPVEVGGL